MCILLVGDEARVRGPLRGMLADAGYRVAEAADGRHGLTLAIELQPQIMLVDLSATEIDGIELTRTLRQFKAGRSSYVLILSDAENDEKMVAAFAAGADGFLILPLQPRLLAAQLLAGKRVAGLQAELRQEREEIRRISAELAVSNKQLKEVGMTDLLTGCRNRRYAMDRMQQEWAMAVRSERPLACMVIDLDNLKQVNDTHGHAAGDVVLKLCASVFRDEMRAQDVLARSAGDEFLVICPDTSLEAALACAERMRAAVEALPIVDGERTTHGSVSIGVAVRDATTPDADALIRLADQSAYMAKRHRNSVATVQSGGTLQRSA
jgi:diguanylate cyclase (GGDEF)-like protein